MCPDFQFDPVLRLKQNDKVKCAALSDPGRNLMKKPANHVQRPKTI